MKITREEHMAEIALVLKALKANKKTWKAMPKWASMYERDVTTLLKELTKAIKISV